MKKTHALVVVSFAAVAVSAAIASCTSFSSGDNGGLGGAGGDTTGGGTGGKTTTGQGGTPDTGAGGANNPGTGGSTTSTGGAGGAQPGTGGRPAGMGGATGMGGAAAGMGGATVPAMLPCDILAAAGNICGAAHSTTRLLNSKYTGPLYQVCKGATQAGPNACLGGAAAMKDIGQIGGYADFMSQDMFCAGAVCTFYTIYDQSGNGNLLRPSPRGGNGPANNPAVATALKTSLNGHTVYGVYIRRGQGYRAGCSQCAIVTPKGTATGDQAETEYMVTSQRGLIDGCCFDYGNAETSSNDDGNGTMEAVYFGGGVVWGTGAEGGHTDATNPWVMADLENGLFAGFSLTNPSNAQRITTNTALHFDYVTAILIGDTAAQNAGRGRFAIYGGNAAAGVVTTMYDGIRPTLGGYVPMKKFGSIILGTGGDNSNVAEGQWFEGIMASGAASIATVNALQANIVAAKYGQ